MTSRKGLPVFQGPAPVTEKAVHATTDRTGLKLARVKCVDNGQRLNRVIEEQPRGWGNHAERSKSELGMPRELV